MGFLIIMKTNIKFQHVLIGVTFLALIGVTILLLNSSKNSVSIDLPETVQTSSSSQSISSFSGSTSSLKKQVLVDIAGENITRSLFDVGANLGFISSNNILQLGQKLPINIEEPIQQVDEGIYPVRISLDDIIPKPTLIENKSRIVWAKYNLNAPIIWAEFGDLFETKPDGSINFEKSLDTSSTVSPIQKKLELGTVHLPYSPLPGEIGNSYIVGHSSNFSFVKSDYNTVFKSFEQKSSPGEEFFIYDYFGRKLKFRVFEALVVNEADVGEAFKIFENRRVVTLQSSILENGKPTKRWLTRAELVI